MVRFVVLVCWLIGFNSTALADRAIPLHIAIEKGLVSVTVNGRGSSTGDSVQVAVRRATPRALSVEVLPGTVLESTSGDVQSMALGAVQFERIGDSYYEADAIELADDQRHVFILQGYCRDFEKPTPKPQSTFNVKPPDAASASILVQSMRVGASAKLTQVAIWIQRSNVSDEEILKAFPVTTEEIQAARQLLVSIDQPGTSLDVQVAIEKLREKLGDKFGNRLAERRAKRASRDRENDRRDGAARDAERRRSAEVRLEVFDKVKIAIENASASRTRE